MADEAKPDRIKVDAAQLTIGMYVVELDRPWTDTTFLFQGFRIRQQLDIRLLQEVCSYVWVDARQSVTVHDQVTANIAQPEALQPAIAKVDFNLEMLQAAPTWGAARDESLRILQAVKLGHVSWQGLAHQFQVKTGPGCPAQTVQPFIGGRVLGHDQVEGRDQSSRRGRPL